MSLHLIRDFYGRMARHDFKSALELFSDDAELEFFGPSVIPLSGAFRGREAVQRFFSTVGSTVATESFQPVEFIDGGNQVVVIGRERSTVLTTNRTFDVEWVQVWTVRGERISRLRNFFDTGSMALAFQ